jgi:hypothetical protein
LLSLEPGPEPELEQADKARAVAAANAPTSTTRLLRRREIPC